MISLHDVKLMQTVFHGEVKVTDVTVSGGATLLPPSPLDDRKYIRIYNNSGATIYYGGSGVTTAAGIPLANGAVSEPLPVGRAELYATNAVLSAGVFILEIS